MTEQTMFMQKDEHEQGVVPRTKSMLCTVQKGSDHYSLRSVRLFQA